MAALQETSEPYLFGGAVRDAAFGAAALTADLDIVVSGKIPETQERPLERTRFGGLRFIVGSHEVDLWRLDQSAVFIDKPENVSIAALLRAVQFSTDAVAVSLRTGKVFAAKEFWDSVERRTISLMNRPSEMDLKVAVRIARLAIKLQLQPSSDASCYFLDVLERHGPLKLQAAESKWPGRRVLDQYMIRKLEAIARETVSAVRGCNPSA